MSPAVGATDDTETRVNVVYIGDTVPELLPFLDTLLVHSTWQFRLVLNGCDDPGHRAVEQARRRHPERMQLVVESSDRILPHGEILDRLLAIETGPLFCFVDSDIFAISETELASLAPGTNEVAGWSCLPIWQSTEDAVLPTYNKRLSGPYVRTESGASLGGTYAACYRTDDLREAVARYGVGFGKARWDELPAAVRHEFERRQLRMDFYDTGQVINLLLDAGTDSVAYREIPSLIHVGDWTSRSRSTRRLKSRIGHFVRSRTPALYRVWAVTWVLTKDMGVRESRDNARIRSRQTQAIRFIQSIEAGTARFDNSPDWMTDRQVFDAISRMLDRGPGEQAAGQSRVEDNRPATRSPHR